MERIAIMSGLSLYCPRFVMRSDWLGNMGVSWAVPVAAIGNSRIKSCQGL